MVEDGITNTAGMTSRVNIARIVRQVSQETGTASTKAKRPKGRMEKGGCHLAKICRGREWGRRKYQ